MLAFKIGILRDPDGTLNRVWIEQSSSKFVNLVHKSTAITGFSTKVPPQTYDLLFFIKVLSFGYIWRLFMEKEMFYLKIGPETGIP